ncbi:hypothetical protein D9758_003924 [Tetrapyrgos nigripes]|uniref:Uncharacterized protein n=1 Tax=Tetrapyrgos nigripes TaxID=182062 RepID=A0A8H5GLL7_9AGAR|nr:hypothetical protein D9758_003924 [Tetrapyrgos nigripes]
MMFGRLTLGTPMYIRSVPEAVDSKILRSEAPRNQEIDASEELTEGFGPAACNSSSILERLSLSVGYDSDTAAEEIPRLLSSITTPRLQAIDLSAMRAPRYVELVEIQIEGEGVFYTRLSRFGLKA